MFDCAGLRKAKKKALFASLPIKDEASLLLFAKFFKIFIASITWKKNAFSFSFLPIKDRSWCRFSARILKNIFSHLVETALSVANDANAFEYSIARTSERLKKVLLLPFAI